MTAKKTELQKAFKAHVDAKKLRDSMRAMLLSHYDTCMNHASSMTTNGSYVIGNENGAVIYRRSYAPDDKNAYLAPIQPKASYFKTTSLERAKDMLERIKLANADNPAVAQCRITTEAHAFRLRVETLEDLMVAIGDDDAE